MPRMLIHVLHCSLSPLSVSVRPDRADMTVLGATIVAGLAAKVWNDTSQLPKATTADICHYVNVVSIVYATQSIYVPRISQDSTCVQIA